MKTNYKSIILYSLVIGLLLSGCRQGQRANAGGDEQSVAKRLIVTNSNALEMLVGLGAAEHIVGINDMTAKSFIDNSRWTSIGNWQNPNIEAIVSLKPDIIVAYQNWPAVGFEDKLNPFHISVERVNCYYMSEYHSDTYLLASFVGKENIADTIVNDFDRLVNMIKDATADIDVKKRVYIEFSSDFAAMGAGTGCDEMLELINATNIAAKLMLPYPRISTEWLLEENPDIIIKIVAADTITVEMHEGLVNRAGWNQLDAVKNGQVYLISSELSSSPRSMIGSLYFGKWCYPERFASVNPDSIHAYWLKKYYGVASCENFVFTLNVLN